MAESKFAIVGSGFAGVSCADELLKAGVDGERIRLYERANHLGGGGRAAERSGGSNMPCQGATFIGGRELSDQFKELGCEPVKLDQFFFEDSTGFKPDLGDGPLSKRKQIIDEMLECGYNLSVQAAVSHSPTFSALPEYQRDMLLAYWTNEFGASPDRVGLLSLITADTVTEAEQDFFGVCRRGGFHKLAQSLLQKLETAGIDIRWNNNLVAVQPEKSQGTFLSFETSDQRPGEPSEQRESAARQITREYAHSAFISVPVDVLRRLELSTSSKRNPRLLIDEVPSAARQKINRIELGSILKVTVALKRPVMEDVPLGYLLLNPRHTGEGLGCGEVWMLPPPEDRTDIKQTLLLYLGGPQVDELLRDVSMNHSKSSKVDLNQRVESYCSERLGVSKSDIESGVEVAAWLQSKGRGAYAYVKADGAALADIVDFDFSNEVLPGLYLGGEGLAPDYLGFVRGAILSGRGAAQSMLRQSSLHITPKLNLRPISKRTSSCQ